MAVPAVLLLAIGAILAFAIEVSVAGVSLNTVGVILMVAGGVLLLIGLFQDALWSDRLRRSDRAAEERAASDPRPR